VSRLLSVLPFAVLVSCSSASPSSTDAGSGADSSTDASAEPDSSTDASAEPDSDAGNEPVRHVYNGTLDSQGNATVTVPEISLTEMPLVQGYVFTDAYAEPGYVMLGNIIPADGTFRFAAGAGNANTDYRLVIVNAQRSETGMLDDGGNATVTVPELSLTNMPLVMGYVFSTAYAEPGYVALGNIVPGDGVFRFAAGSAHANAPYILVIAAGADLETGVLDGAGNATASIPEIVLSDLRAVNGYVLSSAYAEPGYVAIGNILPSDGQFRFAAGGGNAGASFLITWSH
jgi:hypothetical protein